MKEEGSSFSVRVSLLVEQSLIHVFKIHDRDCGYVDQTHCSFEENPGLHCESFAIVARSLVHPSRVSSSSHW